MRAKSLVNYRAVLVLVLAAALARAAPARAGFTLVTASTLSDLQTALQANDSASWSGFDVNNPTVVSTNGVNVQAQGFPGNGGFFGPTTLSGYPAIVDSGGLVPNEFGGYSFGDSRIDLTFSEPVTAAGGLMEAFISRAGAPGIWDRSGFFLSAVDSNGNFLQSFTLNGSSPPFVGIVSDAGNFSRLVIDFGSGWPYPTQVDVGPLELQDSPLVSGVPAPSGLTLASLGALSLLGCCCWCRYRPRIA